MPTNDSVTYWYCDICGGLIAGANQGRIVSKSLLDHHGLLVETDFLIVHGGQDTRMVCSPGQAAGYLNDVPIELYTGESGLAWLLALLSAGQLAPDSSRSRVRDLNQFVDLFRRLRIPFYEEARRRFENPVVKSWFPDGNEVLPYTPEVLRKIAGEPMDDPEQ